MKIVLNIAPFELTEPQREAILLACPAAEVRYAASWPQSQVDALDGSDVDILVSETAPSDMASWPALRWLQLLSAGANQLDGHPIWEQNVLITTASGIHAVAMAQYTVCTLLMLSRGMPEALTFGSSRDWDVRNGLYFRAEVLWGKTVGIIGYGNIGRECARQLHALGMRVVCLDQPGHRAQRDPFLGWPRTGDPEGVIPESWFTPAQLHEMLPACDVVVISAPRTAATEGMIGEEELALMKPSARIIIISRGGIVDETALAEALRRGTIGGAVVDSFAEEPPAETNPVLVAPNTILTPHISGGFEEYWPTLCRLFCQNLERFMVGQPLMNLVNTDADG